MPIVTAWSNGSSMKLAQLSDDPQDGSPSEQIAFMATLDAYAGYQCIDENYTGSVPADVPRSVTPRQVRLVLLAQGLLESVETMIAAQDEATQITWKYASEFRRDDPLLNQLAANLNLTQEQIDEFFVIAANL